MATPDPAARRPLKSREVRVFRAFAAWLARAGVTPNAISFASIVFGSLAGVAFAATAASDGATQRLCWFAATLCIQLRLLANLLDGLVAVEGGKGGPTGDLWNEAPDRFSDAATLIGAGFAAGSEPLLGLSAALVAVFVAYVRALGASVGIGQLFHGPLAKPQRMAVMTGAAFLSALLPQLNTQPAPWVLVALWIVTAGGLFTGLRRLAKAGALLRSRQP